LSVIPAHPPQGFGRISLRLKRESRTPFVSWIPALACYGALGRNDAKDIEATFQKRN